MDTGARDTETPLSSGGEDGPSRGLRIVGGNIHLMNESIFGLYDEIADGTASIMEEYMELKFKGEYNCQDMELKDVVNLIRDLRDMVWVLAHPLPKEEIREMYESKLKTPNVP